MRFSTRLLLTGVLILIALAVYAIISRNLPFTGGDDDSAPEATLTPGAGPPREPLKKEFVFGSVTYEVTDQKNEESLGEGDRPLQAKGRFRVLLMNVRNDGPEPLQFSVEAFALYDEKGRRYSANPAATAAAAKQLEAEDPFGTPLQPGLAAQWALTFDVPQDMQKFVLRISSGYIEVDLGSGQ